MKPFMNFSCKVGDSSLWPNVWIHAQTVDVRGMLDSVMLGIRSQVRLSMIFLSVG